MPGYAARGVATAPPGIGLYLRPTIQNFYYEILFGEGRSCQQNQRPTKVCCPKCSGLPSETRRYYFLPIINLRYIQLGKFVAMTIKRLSSLLTAPACFCSLIEVLLSRCQRGDRPTITQTWFGPMRALVCDRATVTKVTRWHERVRGSSVMPVLQSRALGIRQSFRLSDAKRALFMLLNGHPRSTGRVLLMLRLPKLRVQ